MSVKWSSLAQADFRAFYESALEQDATYALNITEALEEAILRLLAYPRLGTPVGSAGHRKWRLKKTPFLMICTIEADGLYILRVYHELQDWQPTP